jgi:hypothetical protein
MNSFFRRFVAHRNSALLPTTSLSILLAEYDALVIER